MKYKGIDCKILHLTADNRQALNDLIEVRTCDKNILCINYVSACIADIFVEKVSKRQQLNEDS